MNLNGVFMITITTMLLLAEMLTEMEISVKIYMRVAIHLLCVKIKIFFMKKE